MTTIELDPARLEAFAGRMGMIVNDGLLALSISLGHRTGLFDAMAALAPSTSDTIARAAGLQERYVREVLGALVTGGIVEYDPSAQTYVLPAEHAAVTTRAAGVMNLAALTQFVPMVAVVEDDVVRCFHDGGGVPYSKFPTFQRVLAETGKDTIDATLLTSTLDLVPVLRDRLDAGIDVADFGCGSGYALNVLARAFPRSRFTGLDLSDDAIGAARAQAADWGLTNVTFTAADLVASARAAQYDFITTFDVIHDLADPAGALDAIARALRPGGVFLCVDIAASSHLEDNLDHPFGPGLYTLSTMHCMTVSLAQGGAGLGTAWGEQKATEMLHAAGFTLVRAEHVEGDSFNVYYVATCD